MSQTIADIPAVIATNDKRTAAQAKKVFQRLVVSSTAGSFPGLFQKFQARAGRTEEGETDLGVVLLDLDMPKLRADECLAEVRGATRAVSTVILASSGEEALKGLRAGAEDYVLKPIRLEDLVTRVTRLVEQHDEGRRSADLPQMDAPLPHLVENLHDAENGHLDAKKIADFFGLTVAELARLLGRGVSTVHKTSSAPALQGGLRPFEAMASGLLRLTGSERRARMWLNSADPALDGHAPIEWLRMGKLAELAGYIQDTLEGRPA